MTAGGAPVEADAVVVAVPASVIDLIAFDPPLPEAKARALAAVRYGTAAKLFLPLDRPTRAERDAVRPRPLLDVHPARARRRPAAGRGVVRRVAARPRAARGRRGPGRAGSRPSSTSGRTSPIRPADAVHEHLGDRSVGPRRVLGAVVQLRDGRRGARRAGGPAPLRRRAHGGRVARADGGRAAQRVPRGRRAHRERPPALREPAATPFAGDAGPAAPRRRARIRAWTWTSARSCCPTRRCSRSSSAGR